MQAKAERTKRKRERDQRYYVRYSEKIRRQIKQRYDERQAEAWALKRGPCSDCGLSYPPYVMQWDHRNPAEKKFNVSTAVARRVPMETVMAEIAKCDLVCANCHAERTYGG